MTDQHGGSDSDGEGSQGILDEKSREARAGETGTTRVGMEGEETDAPTSHGMVRPQTERERDEARDADQKG